jgi:hypothetical protein
MWEKWQKALNMWRAAVAVIALAFVLSLLWSRFFPFCSQVTFTYRLDGQGDHIPYPLSTSSFLSLGGEGGIIEIPSMKMERDSIFFALKLPFDEVDAAEVEIAYGGDPEEFLFGFRGNGMNAYTFKPIHKRSLDDLDWPRITEEGITLFQRKDTFSSLKDFLASLPSGQGISQPSRIAEYYYHLPQPEPEIDPALAKRTYRSPTAFRGQHTLYAYVASDALRLSFRRLDRNRKRGPDQVNVTVYREEQPVWGIDLPDDGDETESGIHSEPKKESFTIEKGKGIYKVVFTCSDDVLVDGLEVNTPYLTFHDRLSMNANSESQYPQYLEVITNAEHPRVSVAETASAQELRVKESQDKRIYLNEPEVYRSWNLGEGRKTILVRSPGITFSEPGSFFSPPGAAFFDPFPMKCLPYSDGLLYQGIDYVLADYTVTEGDGLIASKRLFFDFPGLTVKDGVLYCCLSAPNLSSSGSTIYIEDLKVKVYRKWKGGGG